jgi:hypothetical protein
MIEKSVNDETIKTKNIFKIENLLQINLKILNHSEKSSILDFNPNFDLNVNISFPTCFVFLDHSVVSNFLIFIFAFTVKQKNKQENKKNNNNNIVVAANGGKNPKDLLFEKILNMNTKVNTFLWLENEEKKNKNNLTFLNNNNNNNNNNNVGGDVTDNVDYEKLIFYMKQVLYLKKIKKNF